MHTLCLPVTNNLHDILISADQQCITGLLAKMGTLNIQLFIREFGEYDGVRDPRLRVYSC